MNKLVPSLSGMACIAWVAISSWWLSAEPVHSLSPDEGAQMTSFTITDNGFSMAANDVFSFELSEAKPDMPTDNQSLLQALSRYLGENPERNLILTGEYLPSERNKTSFQNLGMARAEAIREILVKEGLPTERVIVQSAQVQSSITFGGRMLGGVNFSFQSDDEPEEDVALDIPPGAEGGTLVKEEAPSVNEMDTKEKIELLYEDRIFTLNKKYLSELDQIRRILRQDPLRILIISGYSLQEEESSDEGNLAERRARAVRRYLVDTGVQRKQILLESYPGSGTREYHRRVELKILQNKD